MLAYGHDWDSQNQLPQTLREVSLDCSREELDLLIEFLQGVRAESAGGELDSMSHWHFRDWNPAWTEKHSDLIIWLGDHTWTKEID
ncbi:hypothetical protein D1646_08250 [Pseudoflavonifractor sp. 60]|uniref:Imm32 family immunity protein n=1 Tax=Pseudoflavonifractor sp. 60 TaxID=2304576 RepID=UPI00136D3887|nr:hypothetical protein [Pseudoflavonifractor sp. 60]NBI66808.1 hypothetical protein [Pseudoflavonifractor sp. 60]